MTYSLGNLAVVAVAGGIGCALRVAVRDVLMRSGIHSWWATLCINLVGGFVMGFVAAGASTIEEGSGLWIVRLSTGVLAGWTTYSAFSMDVVQLWIRRQRREAGLLCVITILVTPALALLGGLMASSFMKGQP